MARLRDAVKENGVWRLTLGIHLLDGKKWNVAGKGELYVLECSEPVVTVKFNPVAFQHRKML